MRLVQLGLLAVGVAVAVGTARPAKAQYYDAPEESAPSGQPHTPEGYGDPDRVPPPPQEPPPRPPSEEGPPREGPTHPQGDDRDPWSESQQEDPWHGPPAPPVPARKANSFTIDPLAMLFGFLNVQFENAPAPWVSWFVGPSVLVLDFYLSDLTGYDEVRIFGVDAGLRFFPMGGANAVEGLWVGPQAGVTYVRFEDDVEVVDGVGWLVAGMGGYTWVWGAFLISLGGGLGVFSTGGGDVELLPVSRGALGFAF